MSDLVRNDLIDAYMEKWGCTREYADNMVQHVEITYADTATKDLTEALERAHRAIDDHDGEQMRQESPIIKRLLEENEDLYAKLTKATRAAATATAAHRLLEPFEDEKEVRR